MQSKLAENEDWKSTEIITSKASATLFIEAVPTDSEYITIGNCKVTFEKGAGTGNNSAYVADSNCGPDKIAKFSYYTRTNPGVLLNEEDLTDLLSTLTNVVDVDYKGLTITKVVI